MVWGSGFLWFRVQGSYGLGFRVILGLYRVTGLHRGNGKGTGNDKKGI